MSHDPDSSDSGWVTTFVFIGGFILGASAAFLLAPEPGSILRERLSRGAKTAQEELSDMALETKEAVGHLTKEAQRTVKQTASRFSAAVDATKEALTTDKEHRAQTPYEASTDS